MTLPRPQITVVGLGPAGSAHVGSGVAALLANTERAFLRTSRHPAAVDFDDLESFDALYEAAESFEALYPAIVERLVAEAEAPRQSPSSTPCPARR